MGITLFPVGRGQDFKKKLRGGRSYASLDSDGPVAHVSGPDIRHGIKTPDQVVPNYLAIGFITNLVVLVLRQTREIVYTTLVPDRHECAMGSSKDHLDTGNRLPTGAIGDSDCVS